MLNLRVAWDRPARPPSGLVRHVLLAAVAARDTAPALPGNLCLVLDCSGSMASRSGAATKLENAIAACRAARDALNSDDLLTLITYNSRPIVRFAARRSAELTPEMLDGVLGAIRAQSITCTDQALAEAEHQLRPNVGPDRVSTIILITDGHPTDRNGRNLDAACFDEFHEAARRRAAAGISLITVGLGSARFYNGPFLTRLADAGQGRFCAAPDPAELSRLLREQIGTAQATVASGLEFHFTPLAADVRLIEACRIAPEYCPLEIAGAGPWCVPCGALALARPQDEFRLLVRVETPGVFGMEFGSRPVLQVGASWRAADGTRAAAADIEATIRYSDLPRDHQQTDPQVEPLRIRWEMNRCQEEVLRSASPSHTCEMLGTLMNDARRTGLIDVAEQAQRQIQELRATGRIDADRQMSMSQRLRATADDADRTPHVRPSDFTGFGGVMAETGPVEAPPTNETTDLPTDDERLPSQDRTGFGR